MKNKNKIILGTTSALVIGLLAGTYLLSGLNKVSLAQDRHFFGGFGRPDNVQKAYKGEDFTAIQTAIENQDYDAWQELKLKYSEDHQGKGGSQWDNLIDSQEKFEKFVQMKQLFEEGKYEEGMALKEELGFLKGMGHKFGKGKGMHW